MTLQGVTVIFGGCEAPTTISQRGSGPMIGQHKQAV